MGFGPLGKHANIRPKAVSHYLLEGMRVAGAKKAFVILRQGKWDIPAYLGSGSLVNMPIGYLMVELPYGVPYTLDSAFHFVEDKVVVFGFPDIIFEPKDAFIKIANRLLDTRADIVLGLFPAINPQKMDMVELDGDGRVKGIQIKPTQSVCKYTWILAAWKYSFTRFIHDFVRRHEQKLAESGIDQEMPASSELFIGDVIQSALNSGLEIDNVIFDQGSYIDIGTPEDMAAAIQMKTPPILRR